MVSCFGKLFTAVLNKRLSKFLDSKQLLGENQAGFRAGYSTTDHISNLYMIIEYYLSNKKKLYGAFVDYAKAFDSVLRKGLWLKLINHGIKGKCLIVIINMYNGIKSLIEKNGKFSNAFPCNIGIRQGENLSPLLFAIYLNDLETSFYNFGSEGTTCHNTDDENTSMRLLALLYAEDTVIFASTARDLQVSLDNLSRYSKLWK